MFFTFKDEHQIKMKELFDKFNVQKFSLFTCVGQHKEVYFRLLYVSLTERTSLWWKNEDFSNWMKTFRKMVQRWWKIISTFCSLKKTSKNQDFAVFAVSTTHHWIIIGHSWSRATVAGIAITVQVLLSGWVAPKHTTVPYVDYRWRFKGKLFRS